MSTARKAIRPSENWFARVPTKLLGSFRGWPTERVFLALAAHANETGDCWPSKATIGKLAAVNGRPMQERQIQRALRALERDGLIRTKTKRAGHSTIYTLDLIPAPTEGAAFETSPSGEKGRRGEPPHPRRGEPPPGAASGTSHNKPIEQNQQQGVVVELMHQGLTRKVSEYFASQYSTEAIRQQLRWLPDRNAINSTATLTRAIRESWTEPAAAQRRRDLDEKYPDYGPGFMHSHDEYNGCPIR